MVMHDGDKGVETGAPICMECFRTFKEIEEAELARDAQILNEQRARLHSTLGLPPPASRPVPRMVPRPSRTLVNNVHIGGDNHGNLNVGSLAEVRQSIRVVRESGDPELAATLERLAEAIAASRELEAADRAKAIELLGVIATELGSQRRAPSTLAVVANFAAIVSAASDVAPFLRDALSPMLAALAPGA